jgi:hypothetical protein
MGWASGGAIFDRVAHALVQLGADDKTMRGVLKPLYDELRDGDWDTVEESMDQFWFHPAIMSVLVDAGFCLDDDGNGVLGYDMDTDEWTLTCEHRGCSFGNDGRPCTAEGHDELVRLWAGHEKDAHGGDGEVDQAMLMAGPAADDNPAPEENH